MSHQLAAWEMERHEEIPSRKPPNNITGGKKKLPLSLRDGKAQRKTRAYHFDFNKFMWLFQLTYRKYCFTIVYNKKGKIR
jgi:hypothetical protein